MTQPKYAKVFPPLESDPELFTLLVQALGASSRLHFEDVFSLNDAEFADSPTGKAEAFVLIAPCEDDYEEALRREEAQRMAALTDEQQKTSETVIWVEQTIHNACGFYALLHAVLNIPSAQSLITPGSVLDAILNSKSRQERQNILETSHVLDDAYIPIALQGQTAVADDWAWEPPFHYTCFVGVQERVWQLDGDRRGPVDKGERKKLVHVVRDFMTEQGEGAFSLMALVVTKNEHAQDTLAGN
jgi:ubiquitin carboxyl-terminal hydrolase L3